MQVPSPSQKDPLEEGMATHPTILFWRISWTEDPDGLQSMGSQRVQHDWAAKHIACVHAKLLKLCLTLCDLWTVACQGPLSMRFSRKEYWGGLSCPPPRDLPNLGIEPRSSALHSLLSEPPGKPKHTGVGNLSLLQGIFLTQESN